MAEKASEKRLKWELLIKRIITRYSTLQFKRCFHIFISIGSIINPVQLISGEFKINRIILKQFMTSLCHKHERS